MSAATGAVWDDQSAVCLIFGLKIGNNQVKIATLRFELICRLSLSPPQMPLQKLLFSATLTQNPEKLQQLDLHQPRLFSSTHRQAGGAAPAARTAERYDFPQGLTVTGEPSFAELSRVRLLIGAVVLSGVLRSLYAEQKAPPPPPLHPQDEAQPRPLLHQLQTGCSQVGGRRASARFSSEKHSVSADLVPPQTFPPGSAVWRSSGG